MWELPRTSLRPIGVVRSCPIGACHVICTVFSVGFRVASIVFIVSWPIFSLENMPKACRLVFLFIACELAIFPWVAWVAQVVIKPITYDPRCRSVQQQMLAALAVASRHGEARRARWAKVWLLD